MMRNTRIQGVPVWHNPKYFAPVNRGHLHGDNGALGIKEKFKVEVTPRLLTDSIPFDEAASKKPRDALKNLKGFNAELVCATRTDHRNRPELRFYYM